MKQLQVGDSLIFSIPHTHRTYISYNFFIHTLQSPEKKSGESVLFSFFSYYVGSLDKVKIPWKFHGLLQEK